MTNNQSSIINNQFPRPLPLQPEELEARSPELRKTFLQWLESEYFLSEKVHGLSTKWSLEYGPFWKVIIEALDDTTTREVWVYAPAQSGKSTIMTGWLGHTVAEDPVPMGLVMPRDTDAAERVECNIIPMFEENPRLLRHAGGSVRKINIGKMTMFDNMAFYLLFATSSAAMSGKAICKIGLDEVGKYPPTMGKEAGPVKAGRDRLETFKNRSKLFGITTPVLKDDVADREWKKGDRCEWWPRCISCSRYHKNAWSHVQLDKNGDGSLLDPEEYSRGGRAHYVCPRCGTILSEIDRWQSMCDGKWCPDGCEIDDGGHIAGDYVRPSVRSFRITAWMLHPAIQTMGYLAARWADAMLDKQRGDTEALQAFVNSRMAEVWEQKESQPEESKLYPHIGGAERNIVPAGAGILTAAVDVQLDHVWLAVVAWGYQFEGWLIEARRIETGDTEKVENFDQVHEYLALAYDMVADPDSVMSLTVAGIDSAYHTDQVNAVCRAWPELPVVPIWGWAENRMPGRLYRPVRLSEDLTRYDLNVDRFKDSMFRQLFVADVPGPGFFHLFTEIPPEYLRQLVSEHQIRRREGRRDFFTWVKRDSHSWVKRDSHWPNHLWDLLVYNRFLAEIAGVPAIQNPKAETPSPGYAGRPIGAKPVRTKY